MCGICGYISKAPVPDGTALTERMIKCLAHRGPDHQEQCGNDKVRMGFARLAILDLSSAGNQPMDDDSGQYSIVFNGEAFNYVELRRELEGHGHIFRSSSDTEVVLKAYVQWGAQSFKRLRGMWALCIWDKQEGKLVFARDYFGIKPLYFYSGGDVVYWSSEIKAFRTVPVGLVENTDVSSDYVKYGLLDHSEHTFFKKVWQLRSGQMAEITSDLGVRKSFYWKLEESVRTRNVPDTEQEQVKAFRSILLDSINISLRSDVPVWILLPGGLDSSSIVSIVRRLYPDRPIHTVLVVHTDPAINEYEYVQAVQKETACRVEFVGIRHDQWLNEMDNLVYHQGEPTTSTTVVNHWFLMKELNRRGIKVVLSGQGVDEMLYGYVDIFMGYLFADLFGTFQLGRLFDEVRAHWISRERNLQCLRQKFHMQMLKSLVSQTCAKEFKARFLEKSSSLLRRVAPDAVGAENRGYGAREVPQFDRLHNTFYRMLSVESIPRILHYEDRNSMAFSIEQRVPFLDREVAEFLFALPTDMKVRCGQSKWILREALKGILPEKVRMRRTKLGFNTPESEWIMSKQFQGYVEDRKVFETLDNSVVDAARFRRRVSCLLARECSYNPVFWRIYDYALWKQRFKV